MKLPVSLFCLFALLVCLRIDVRRHDWPVAALLLAVAAVAAVATVLWTYRRTK